MEGHETTMSDDGILFPQLCAWSETTKPDDPRCQAGTSLPVTKPQIVRLTRALLPRRWQDLSPAAKDLLMGMLRYNPKHRLTSQQVWDFT